MTEQERRKEFAKAVTANFVNYKIRPNFIDTIVDEVENQLNVTVHWPLAQPGEITLAVNNAFARLLRHASNLTL